jgi:hypothetical protein
MTKVTFIIIIIIIIIITLSVIGPYGSLMWSMVKAAYLNSSDIIIFRSLSPFVFEPTL